MALRAVLTAADGTKYTGSVGDKILHVRGGRPTGTSAEYVLCDSTVQYVDNNLAPGESMEKRDAQGRLRYSIRIEEVPDAPNPLTDEQLETWRASLASAPTGSSADFCAVLTELLARRKAESELLRAAEAPLRSSSITRGLAAGGRIPCTGTPRRRFCA